MSIPAFFRRFLFLTFKLPAGFRALFCLPQSYAPEYFQDCMAHDRPPSRAGPRGWPFARRYRQTARTFYFLRRGLKRRGVEPSKMPGKTACGSRSWNRPPPVRLAIGAPHQSPPNRRSAPIVARSHPKLPARVSRKIKSVPDPGVGQWRPYKNPPTESGARSWKNIGLRDSRQIKPHSSYTPTIPDVILFPSVGVFLGSHADGPQRGALASTKSVEWWPPPGSVWLDKGPGGPANSESRQGGHVLRQQQCALFFAGTWNAIGLT